MSFRRRMVLLAAGAVAAAIVIASVVVYIVTRNELRGQLDASLLAKVTPGRQLVKVEAHLDQQELARLAREGKLPAPALSAGFGLATKAGGTLSASTRIGGGAVSASTKSAGGGASASTKAGGSASASTKAGAGASQPTGIVETAPVPVEGLQSSVRVSGSAQHAAPIHTPAGAVRSAGVAQEGAGEAPAATLTQGTLTFLQHIAHVPKGLPSFTAGQVRLVLQGPAVEGPTGYAQLSLANGEVLAFTGRNSLLPSTPATRAVASGRRDAFYSDVDVHGTPVRVLTSRAVEGAAWQVALPLSALDNTLDRLRLVLALVVLGGIALAAALGLLVSRAALAPVRRLTGAAEDVTRTQDLGHRIEIAEDDELGRLSASFNTMLAALERARLAQRQLISDASHELRTPLTSVQANLDALASTELPADERARILTAARAQLRELTVLVGDLVDLSKNELEEIEIEDVRLDLAAAAAIERARLHAPGCRFELDAEPCLVRAAPARLDRAIANLLDNAFKWNPPSPPSNPPSPPGGRADDAVEVRVRDGRLEVRDHGPGIDPEDLPRVFDRFFRAPAARGRPGSGLGLAIVRQTAETHGGAVHAVNDPGGGARLILELPALAMTAAELAASRAEETPAADTAAGAVQEAPRLR